VTPVTYFGATFIEALDAITGQQVWRRDFASAFSINPPTYDNGRVYLQRGNHASDTQLWCLNSDDGSVIWSAPHAAQWERYYAPTVFGDGIWVDGGYYGGMYGFGTNGTQRFFYSALAQYDQWTPTWYQGSVYSWVEGVLRAHDPISGSLLWSASFGWNWDGWSMNTVSALDNGFAFVAQRPNLIAVDLSTHAAALWGIAPGACRVPVNRSSSTAPTSRPSRNSAAEGSWPSHLAFRPSTSIATHLPEPRSSAAASLRHRLVQPDVPGARQDDQGATGQQHHRVHQQGSPRPDRGDERSSHNDADRAHGRGHHERRAGDATEQAVRGQTLSHGRGHDVRRRDHGVHHKVAEESDHGA